MIPRTYPTLIDGRKAGYMRVFYLTSVTGLTKWIDYIPVKTVAFSAAAEGTTNANGHINVVQVASSTALRRWVDYIPVFEDGAATVPWSTNANGYIPVDQMLDLDFRAGILDSRITFTRADATTCATYFDSTGKLATAAANVPRFDYDPATLQPRGLLIEESRQNLLLQSRDMTQAAWGKTDVTPTRNQVGIDGVANTACLMTEGSAGTAVTVQPVTVSAGSTITVSVVAKRGNTDWLRVQAAESTITDGGQGWFNLATGVKGTANSFGAGSGVSSTMTNLGGGWYRCTVTATPNGTYTTAAMRWRSASADASGTLVSGATYIVDCAQLEVGAFATSIIPTTTTALTRAADSASMTGTNFSSWFNASAGTFVAEGDVSNFTASQPIFRAYDGIGNEAVRAYAGTSNQFQAQVTEASVLKLNASLSTLTANVAFKGAICYDASGQAACLNGGTVGTSGTGAIGTIDATQLEIMKTGGLGSGTGNGHIRSLRFYPSRLPNATLQALTA